MRDYWIQISARILGYNRHVSSVQEFELELPVGHVWTSNNSRWKRLAKAAVVAFANGDNSLQYNGESVNPRFFTWKFGLTEAKDHYPHGKNKIANAGWMETEPDDTGDDNILNLPEPSH